LRAAAGMVDGGLYESNAAIAPGRTEDEIAGAALRAMYALGTEWMPINPGVSSGRGAFRRFATSKKVNSGDSVVVNLSAMNDGYCAEATRTFVAGPSSPMKSDYAFLRETYDSLAKRLMPGTRLAEIFAS